MLWHRVRVMALTNRCRNCLLPEGRVTLQMLVLVLVLLLLLLLVVVVVVVVVVLVVTKWW